MNEGDASEPGDDRPLATRLAEAEAALTQVRTQVQQVSRALEDARKEVRAGARREARLEGELQHRVRNMLAVVRSVFSRTAATHDTVEEVADHFCGRLEALARHHTGSLGPQPPPVEIEDIVRDELLRVGAEADPRVAIDGPDCTLIGQQAESFGLAVHELVTNSIKFGVLAPDMSQGEIAIGWSASPDRLTFCWRETGMAVIGSVPRRYGFGREFLEQSLPYQLDAETSFELAPGALTCIIATPLAVCTHPT